MTNTALLTGTGDHTPANNTTGVAVTILSPDVAVLGSGSLIAAGDPTPATADGTDFSAVGLGTTVTHTFTISNGGAANLTVGSVSLSGPAAGEFSLGGLITPTTVVPEAATEFRVSFTPAITGARAATVTVASDAPGEGPYDFAVQGTGQAPDIAVLGGGSLITTGDSTPATADGTDFGVVRIGAAVTHTFTFSNSGSADLTVSSLSLSGPAAADFSLAGIITPTTIVPGATADFWVGFTLAVAGTRAATVTVASDDPGGSAYDFAVQGTGSNRVHLPLVIKRGAFASSLAVGAGE